MYYQDMQAPIPWDPSILNWILQPAKPTTVTYNNKLFLLVGNATSIPPEYILPRTQQLVPYASWQELGSINANTMSYFTLTDNSAQTLSIDMATLGESTQIEFADIVDIPDTYSLTLNLNVDLFTMPAGQKKFITILNNTGENIARLNLQVTNNQGVFTIYNASALYTNVDAGNSVFLQILITDGQTITVSYFATNESPVQGITAIVSGDGTMVWNIQSAGVPITNIVSGDNTLEFSNSGVGNITNIISGDNTVNFSIS
jgi:hypothetical protein